MRSGSKMTFAFPRGDLQTWRVFAEKHEITLTELFRKAVSIMFLAMADEAFNISLSIMEESLKAKYTTYMPEELQEAIRKNFKSSMSGLNTAIWMAMKFLLANIIEEEIHGIVFGFLQYKTKDGRLIRWPIYP